MGTKNHRNFIENEGNSKWINRLVKEGKGIARIDPYIRSTIMR